MFLRCIHKLNVKERKSVYKYVKPVNNDREEVLRSYEQLSSAEGMKIGQERENFCSHQGKLFLIGRSTVF